MINYYVSKLNQTTFSFPLQTYATEGSMMDQRARISLVCAWISFTLVLLQVPCGKPLLVPPSQRAFSLKRVYRTPHVTTSTMMAKPSTPMPRNVKETVNAMRSAVQEGLKDRQSRMDVDLPFAARLGVEVDESGNKSPSAKDIQKSDRELARLFVEMFDVLGDHLVVVFSSDAEAKAAKKVWDQGAPYKGRVTCFFPKKTSVRAKKNKGGVAGFSKKVLNERKD
ncbi:unnamed protein product, partial [Choristocarpus tenellus]